MLEAVRKLPALGVGNNEKERRFCAFSDETEASLVRTGDVQRSVSISGGDARQWLSSFGVERERVDEGAGVCCCAREKEREIKF